MGNRQVQVVNEDGSVTTFELVPEQDFRWCIISDRGEQIPVVDVQTLIALRVLSRTL